MPPTVKQLVERNPHILTSVTKKALVCAIDDAKYDYAIGVNSANALNIFRFFATPIRALINLNRFKDIPQRDQITDQNAPDTLRHILKSDGGSDTLSFKCLLLCYLFQCNLSSAKAAQQLIEDSKAALELEFTPIISASDTIELSSYP